METFCPWLESSSSSSLTLVSMQRCLALQLVFIPTSFEALTLKSRDNFNDDDDDDDDNYSNDENQDDDDKKTTITSNLTKQIETRQTGAVVVLFCCLVSIQAHLVSNSFFSQLAINNHFNLNAFDDQMLAFEEFGLQFKLVA